ncbi:hypothetical protein BG006_003302 [Podila minutissima]|uniref:Uncharacterized protein n=1 Tax=Podila minutissima TaxID=64525 RepID=A0A9P5SRI3_9FUNG|nr:hypothetical protein BG006_003302 [Podila minutissima]
MSLIHSQAPGTGSSSQGTVSTNEGKGKGKVTTKKAGDDMGDEIKGGAMTVKGKCKRKTISNGGSIEEDEAAEAEEPVFASIETNHCWAIAAAYGKMGVLKIKYKTFMALVCSRSYFVCDHYLSYSTGKELRSHIPLAVQVNGDAANMWMLCHNCQREYYRKRPKWLRPPCNSKDKTTYVANKKICKTDGMWDYWLDGSDLAGLQYNIYENLYSARGYPMCLYDERAIQKRAHNVHAGWVANIPKSRRAAFKLREELNKIRRMPKKEKKPKPTKTPEVPTLDQHGNDGCMCESVWGDFFDDNYGEGPSNQFGNL